MGIKSVLLVLVMVIFSTSQANVASAIPVEFAISGWSGMYDPEEMGFNGSIVYDTSSFVNSRYDVQLQGMGDYSYYAGSSQYTQLAPSSSIFRLAASDWYNFNINDFNSSSDFINSILIKTDSGPRASVTFESISDKYHLKVENLHLDVAALAYASDTHFYDLPTASTPFDPWYCDWSEYYYNFWGHDFTDGGYVASITPVPEPGTVLLLACGLAVVWALGCQRKRRGRPGGYVR